MTKNRSPIRTAEPTEQRECWRYGPTPPEHCGDIFCAVCAPRFPLAQAELERTELAEYFGTYDAYPPHGPE